MEMLIKKTESIRDSFQYISNNKYKFPLDPYPSYYCERGNAWTHFKTANIKERNSKWEYIRTRSPKCCMCGSMKRDMIRFHSSVGHNAKPFEFRMNICSAKCKQCFTFQMGLIERQHKQFLRYHRTTGIIGIYDLCNWSASSQCEFMIKILENFDKRFIHEIGTLLTN